MIWSIDLPFLAIFVATLAATLQPHLLDWLPADMRCMGGFVVVLFSLFWCGVHLMGDIEIEQE